MDGRLYSGRVDCGWSVVERSETVDLPLPQIHRAKRRPTDVRGILEHLVEHWGQIAGRRTDDLQHFGRCGLLLEGFFEIARLGLHLVEQPDVLNGDDGLVAERLQQCDLTIS